MKMYVLKIILIIILVYLLMLMPNMNKERKEAMSSFEDVYIAHRGLFNNVDIPENSLIAFKRAVKHGYGIELDVQMTTDKKLVVFHDVNLFRMCGVDKKLTDCSYEELQKYSLVNTKHKIPLFEDVLKELDKDTPLIVEIKPEGPCIETCDLSVEMLKNYDLNYVMESFNPLVVYHLKKNYPDIIRGQLAYNMFKDKKNTANMFVKFVGTNLLANFLTKPDFVAYDVRNKNNLSFNIVSRLYKAECVAWTVKNQSMLEDCNGLYQQIIFDSFIPKK